MATLSLKISDYMKDVWQEGMLNLFRRSSSNNANFRWDVLGSLTFITVHVPSIYYLTIQLKPWLLSTSFNYEAIFIFCNICCYYLHVFLEITKSRYWWINLFQRNIHVSLFLSMETKKTQAYVHLMSWKGTLIAISRLQLF